MEKLFETFVSNINTLKFSFKRYLADNIDWSNRLIAITGPRGVGKTVMIQQYIRDNFKLSANILYTSLDNIYFSANTLSSLADTFVKNGGEYLFLDEVHKYPQWSAELKNIYDNYPALSIVFTGSSILNINKGFADLSRRAVNYSMRGLSFREYLSLEKGVTFETYTLGELLRGHLEISKEISSKIKPIAEFKNYLSYGYYPYFRENKALFHQKLLNTLNVIIESDLLSVHPLEYKNINNLKKLLYIISEAVPFKVNTTKLAERISVSRNSVILFFDYLKQAQLINFVNPHHKNLGYLTKPEKVYLDNTNQMFALSRESVNIGSLRETFFLNQLSSKHQVNASPDSDFLVDGALTFEVGGKNKTPKQVRNIEEAYIAMDDIEFGYKNTIPLWLFGFLY
jgi:predicted AAA+ superfamily ATPase